MFLVAQWLVFPKMLQLQLAVSNFGSKYLLGVLMLSYAAIHTRTPTLRMDLLVVPFTTYYSVLGSQYTTDLLFTISE